jgi:ABC-2 type transport system permease protein
MKPISNPESLTGFYTLLYKEVLRFWKVAFQTIAAPVLTALLYFVIFSQVVRGGNEPYPGVSYVQFLVPGLAMMAMLQNAFANSSSSLIQSKITGNILFILLPPLSHWNLFWAYLVASVVRGFVVGLGVFVFAVLVVQVPVAQPVWILVFGILGCGVLGALGIIAGIWADKFDQLAAFTNFLITPLTFLAGVFYSVHALPPVWQTVSHANPFFYMIDGFRYGFFGQGDVSPWLSLAVVTGFFLLVAGGTAGLLKSGYKLRS